nr:macro domain-containing protein [Verrucomicrobium spinosum]
MKKIQGDLLKLALAGEFDVIVHGCNCHCTMGAGIAKSIKSLFPEAYEADCQTKKGDREKLGTISQASVNRDGTKLTIVNAYTQFHWRGTGVKADYNAIRSIMRAIKNSYHGWRIGYPSSEQDSLEEIGPSSRK